MVCDAKGRLLRFALTGGQRADVSQAISLLTGTETGVVIADKAYESNLVLGFIRDQGAEAVIPPKANRKEPWEYERELYRQRNLIERAFMDNVTLNQKEQARLKVLNSLWAEQ